MNDERLKIEIELHFPGDGRAFLNFWNYMTGDDVVAEIKDGKLYDEGGKEISLQKFVDECKGKFTQ